MTLLRSVRTAPSLMFILMLVSSAAGTAAVSPATDVPHGDGLLQSGTSGLHREAADVPRPDATNTHRPSGPLQESVPVEVDILFVFGSRSGPNSAEESIIDRLEDTGYTVITERDTEVESDDADDVRMVMISKTVTSTNVGDKFRHTSKGVLTWEDNLQTLGMLDLIDNDGSGSTSWHSDAMNVYVEPDAPADLTTGLSGIVQFYTSTDEMSYAPSGDLPATATRIARFRRERENRYTLYCYDEGDILASGSPSEGRRYYFGLYEPPDTFPLLTADGLALFDAAVEWTIGDEDTAPAWRERPDLNQSLPPSIRIFEHEDAERPSRAWLVRADPSDTTWSLRAVRSTAPGGAETVASLADRLDALLAINGGYFGGSTSYSLIIDNGALLSPNIKALTRDDVTYYPTRGAFGQLDDGTLDVAWVYDVEGTTYTYPRPNPNQNGIPQPQPAATYPDGGSPWPVHNGIGGGPVLVMDGVVDVTWEDEVFFGGSGVDLTSQRARTIVGTTADNELLILIWSEANSRGITLAEAADIMLDAGAVEAVNLDGGGSTSFSVAGSDLLNTGRPVVSALVFVEKSGDEEPDPEAEYVDTGDDCCYNETGAWFDSGNNPYFGTTPSRLAETGDGSARAVFELADIESGRYEVAAWWVASSNRAMNTPYTIYEQGEGTTVRVDQRSAATLNQWNDLGIFDLAPGDSIVVSNDASGATSPAYVNVDAIRVVAVSGTLVETRPGRAPASLQPHPNPASTAFRISIPGRERGSIRLIDVLGRTVYRAETGPGDPFAQLEAAGLAPGLYLVEFVSDEQRRTATVTIVR